MIIIIPNVRTFVQLSPASGSELYKSSCILRGYNIDLGCSFKVTAAL